MVCSLKHLENDMKLNKNESPLTTFTETFASDHDQVYQFLHNSIKLYFDDVQGSHLFGLVK